MTFEHLLQGAEILSQSGNASISGIEYDSRRVKPGDAFVAMRGESSDGNNFIDKAISEGAVAVITDSASEKPRNGVAWAQVPHGRRALARLSTNFYKRPAERLTRTLPDATVPWLEPLNIMLPERFCPRRTQLRRH